MSNGIEISLCMIVKNEEDVLERCLLSIKEFVDEIIIVDTGSIDKTKEIARENNGIVYDFQWCDDFAKARNYAFSKATKEYIFWLDADDYITEENLRNLMELKKTLDRNVDAVSFHYSLSRDSIGNTIYSLRRNRLVRRDRQFIWVGRIHEYLAVAGNIKHADIYVHHGKVHSQTERNLKIFWMMKKEGEVFSARDLYYFANELYYHQLYEEAVQEYEQYLQEGGGWIEDRKNAVTNLSECYLRTEQLEKSKSVLLGLLKEDSPRADICCKLGDLFIIEGKIESAIFWYKVAMGCHVDEESLGINAKAYYTWVPTLQLCVCYDRLEKYQEAYYYNELASYYLVEQDRVELNRTYLENKMRESNIQIPILKPLYTNLSANHL